MAVLVKGGVYMNNDTMLNATPSINLDLELMGGSRPRSKA